MNMRIPFPRRFFGWRPGRGLVLCALLLLSGNAWALAPEEVLVVANGDFLHSGELASYYMSRRGIPEKNVVYLSVTTSEYCSREEYDRKIIPPIRACLEERDSQKAPIRCLLLMRGVPLVVGPREDRKEKTRLESTLRRLQFQQRQGKNKGEEYQKDIKRQIDEIQARLSSLAREDESASIDSELTLVRQPSYPLSGWIPNPHYLGFRGKKPKGMPAGALLVSRLDASSAATVKRMIDDSLAAEQNSLKGKAYFDARWPEPGEKDLTGYAFYDASIHRAARRVKDSALMPVTLDEKDTLFQPGDCPDAALYCGWYSLATYVDAFKWVPGSVGYHIASAECQTLRQPMSKVWCKLMLDKGAAATIGPVAEPYVEAFPVPEVFFAALVKGNLSLAECYAIATPFLSWRMVLIGDPLYRPFKYKEKR